MPVTLKYRIVVVGKNDVQNDVLYASFICFALMYQYIITENFYCTVLYVYTVHSVCSRPICLDCSLFTTLIYSTMLSVGFAFYQESNLLGFS